MISKTRRRTGGTTRTGSLRINSRLNRIRERRRRQIAEQKAEHQRRKMERKKLEEIYKVIFEEYTYIQNYVREMRQTMKNINHAREVYMKSNPKDALVKRYKFCSKAGENLVKLLETFRRYLRGEKRISNEKLKSLAEYENIIKAEEKKIDHKREVFEKELAKLEDLLEEDGYEIPSVRSSISSRSSTASRASTTSLPWHLRASMASRSPSISIGSRGP